MYSLWYTLIVFFKYLFTPSTRAFFWAFVRLSNENKLVPKHDSTSPCRMTMMMVYVQHVFDDPHGMRPRTNIDNDCIRSNSTYLQWFHPRMKIVIHFGNLPRKFWQIVAQNCLPINSIFCWRWISCYYECDKSRPNYIMFRWMLCSTKSTF